MNKTMSERNIKVTMAHVYGLGFGSGVCGATACQVAQGGMNAGLIVAGIAGILAVIGSLGPIMTAVQKFNES